MVVRPAAVGSLNRWLASGVLALPEGGMAAARPRRGGWTLAGRRGDAIHRRPIRSTDPSKVGMLNTKGSVR